MVCWELKECLFYGFRKLCTETVYLQYWDFHIQLLGPVIISLFFRGWHYT